MDTETRKTSQIICLSPLPPKLLNLYQPNSYLQTDARRDAPSDNGHGDIIVQRKDVAIRYSDGGCLSVCPAVAVLRCAVY